MTDKIKRKINETPHYKLIRVTYLDTGYNAGCRYIHYCIVDKVTGTNVGMFSDLKLARRELKNMELKKNE